MESRPTVLRCRHCLAEVRLTAGTVMHGTRTPLLVWFWGAYLVTTHTPGLSAVQFQRQLGIKRYETAFQVLHKLRAAMVRPGRDRIGSDGCHVEVDEAFVGGRTRGEGHGKTRKILVAGAVEARVLRKPRRKGERQFYAGRLRLACVTSRGQSTLESFVQANVDKGTTVVTDGCPGYDRLSRLGYAHAPITIRGDQDQTDEHLPMIHLVFSNLKSWLLGTHHGVSHRHLPAYLNEFVFRFNRRFYPMSAVDSVLGIAMRTTGPTKAGLYTGRWKHPATPG
jgi:transposase-like protein